LRSYDSTPRPPLPLPLLSLSQSSWLSPDELIDGREGRAGGEEPTLTTSLVLYKSFSTLCAKLQAELGITKIWIASGKISTGESGSGNAAAVKGEIQRKYISKKTKVGPKTAASENRIFCLTQKICIIMILFQSGSVIKRSK
jgi:hypothetical protein